MSNFVYVYNAGGDKLGFIRIGQDDVGQTAGEVYDNTPNHRFGAVRCQPMQFDEEEGHIFNQEGAQIGASRLNKSEGGKMEGSVYLTMADGTDSAPVLRLKYEPSGNNKVQIYRAGQGSQIAGTLESEAVDPSEMILMGGGAALLLMSKSG